VSNQRYSPRGLMEWCSAIFRAVGVPKDHAEVAAQVIVRTNLRGVDTHGVTRILPYLQKIECGEVTPVPQFSEKIREGVLKFHGDGGLGQVAATIAMDSACRIAQETAVVAGVLIDVGHLGALGMYVLRAAESGMIALLAQATPPVMALPGATRPAIGNNPLAFGFPIRGCEPFVMDMACSRVARGNLLVAVRERRPIPEGWAIGPDGEPTTDAECALKGAMLPFGDYKGIALAMMVECLGGSLTGAKPPSIAETGSGSAAGHVGAFFLVINPDHFGDRAAFDAHTASWIENYRHASGPSGRYPGHAAALTERDRNLNGVPLSDALVDELRRTGQHYGVAFDVLLSSG
jgi:LDH2 family malate/lactate/ureidoglycolate dehydrogenase